MKSAIGESAWSWTLVLVGLVLLACALCAVTLVRLASSSSESFVENTLYDTDNGEAVARAFLMSMRLNHDRAYAISSPSLHNRIRGWMVTHDSSIMCNSFDNGSIRSFGSGIPDQYDMIFSCRTSAGNYELHIDGIQLERDENDNWIVTNYEPPQESSD